MPGTDQIKITVTKLLLVETDPAKREQLLELCHAQTSAPLDVEICTRPREAVARLAKGDFQACLLPNDLPLLREARRAATSTLYLLISDGTTPMY